MCGLELSEYSKKSLTENDPVWDWLCVKVLGISQTQNHVSGHPRVVEMFLPGVHRDRNKKKWNSPENSGLEVWSQEDGIREDRWEESGAPSTVNSLGVYVRRSVCVRHNLWKENCSRRERYSGIVTVGCLFVQSVSWQIYKDRRIEVCHVKGHINSLKKQGTRLNGVKGTTIAMCLQPDWL